MNTLTEDQYVRSEKLRKQELYRNMLDQQVRFNEAKREKEIQSLKHPFSDPRNANQRSSLQYPTEETRHLPPLASRSDEWQTNRQGYPRSVTEEDKTEIYLSNCEEIIRNLRELKSKKRKWQSPSSQLEGGNRGPLQLQRNKTYQMQYYPKPSYFSSSGSAYNKNTGSTDPSPKYNKLQSTRINTIEDRPSQPDRSSNKNISSKVQRNKRLLEKLTQPPPTAAVKSPRSGEKDKNEGGESLSPSGLRYQSRVPAKKQSKLRQKLIKVISPKGQYEGGGEQQQQQMPEHSESRKNEKHNGGSNASNGSSNGQQHELTSCVIELTKYLKTINEHRSEKLKPQSGQRQQKPEQEQQYIEPEVQQSRINTITIKPERVLMENPPNSASRKKSQKQPDQKHLKRLQDNVLSALRKANQKSHHFLIKMTDRSAEKSRMERSERQHSVRKSEDDEQEYLGNNPNPNEELDRSANPEHQEEVKQLINFLERQDSNNEQLNRCLKELYQYLRHQNQQIKELKSFRESQFLKEVSRESSKQKIPEKSHSKSPKERRKEIQLSPKEAQQKLQQSILKNLKKARMRGNKFKQRVENYRKEHQGQGGSNQGNSNEASKQTAPNPSQKKPQQNEAKKQGVGNIGNGEGNKQSGANPQAKKEGGAQASREVVSNPQPKKQTK